MKLDVNALRYLSKDDFRVLTAVEMGMRNHEIVPTQLIDRIASLKHGGTYKVLKNLLKHKLLHHDSSKYDGFRLTYLGYDFLAIKTMVNRGVFTAVGRKIGTGKESDIFEVATEDGTVLAMKLHRLGRVSFRAVKSKRDYLKHRTSYNWLYLSRLAALKEFSFMKALENHDFPVPHAVDCNRHCVVMSLVEGYPLEQVKQLQNPEEVFETITGLVVRLAEHGLIHCDFNEFNIMIGDDERVTMIDFPQMVSVSHTNAQMYFDRDIDCIFKFFSKRFNLSFEENSDEQDSSDADSDDVGKPRFANIKKVGGFLDRELAASGFTRKDQDDIEQFTGGDHENHPCSDDEENEDDHREKDEGSIEELNSLCLHKGEDNPVDLPGGTSTEETEKEGEIEGDDDGNERQDEATSVPDEDGEDDPELTKRLSRQRRRAIHAAQGGRKICTSRNSYKDKGGRSSHNSKIQKNMCN